MPLDTGFFFINYPHFVEYHSHIAHLRRVHGKEQDRQLGGR